MLLRQRLKVFLPPPGSSQGATSSTLATSLMKPARAWPWLPHQCTLLLLWQRGRATSSHFGRYFPLLPHVALMGSLPPMWLQTLPLQQQLHLYYGQFGHQLQHLSLCCSWGPSGSSTPQNQQWGAALGLQSVHLGWLAGSGWQSSWRGAKLSLSTPLSNSNVIPYRINGMCRKGQQAQVHSPCPRDSHAQGKGEKSYR